MSDRQAFSTKPRLHALTIPKEEGLDDKALIAGLQVGDERVAAQLYQRLVSTVDRALYRIFGRREQDHDDLVQATFEQIVLTLCSRRFEGACSLKTWASRLAAHVGLKALRSRQRERKVVDWGSVIEDSVHPSLSDVETDMEVRADIQRLRTLLARINPRRAEVVLLTDVLGHDLAEVSEMMGLSIVAAQSLLARGRKDLSEGLRTTQIPRGGTRQ